VKIGVIGAGIIGLAVARRMTELRPDATVTVLEKEDRIAAHQTGRNSGVLHAGIYYAPGSLKARLCRRGVELLRAYCEERAIPLEECGKLVVALDDFEIDRLRELARRAEANGAPGMRWLETTSSARSSRTPQVSRASTRRRPRSPITARSRRHSPTTSVLPAAPSSSARR
jgi:L-2-hydroxyglutarate oxidase LhgO